MENLFLKLKELYAINPTSSEKVTKGFLSDNLILDCGEKKYFLKRYRFDNEGRIKDIHSVKKYFGQNGIPVIMPIPTKDGDTYFEYEDGFYTLFPFVEGKHLSGNRMSDAAIQSLGKMLGHIHLAGAKAEPLVPMDDYFKPWHTARALELKDQVLGIIAAIPKDERTEFDDRAEKNLLLKKKLLQEHAVTYESLGLKADHLTHGDYMAQNVFFDNNDEVAHVFDFEKTEYAPRTFELYRSAVTSLLCDDNPTDEHISRLKMYIDAYASVYPISKEELMAGLKLFFMRLIHGQWVENEHYIVGSNRVDSLLRTDILRVEFFAERMEEMLQAFSL